MDGAKVWLQLKKHGVKLLWIWCNLVCWIVWYQTGRHLAVNYIAVQWKPLSLDGDSFIFQILKDSVLLHMLRKVSELLRSWYAWIGPVCTKCRVVAYICESVYTCPTWPHSKVWWKTCRHRKDGMNHMIWNSGSDVWAVSRHSSMTNRQHELLFSTLWKNWKSGMITFLPW